jgi:16S rRNA (guanine966-N2)-methyltransferase
MDKKIKIIAGNLKNRTIKIPKKTETRPALILVRRVICDTLMLHVPDAVVLDLFAGTGAFVLEMLSRGAKSAVAIDLERNMTDSIQANAETFGVDDRLSVMNSDYLRAISNLGNRNRKFDIVIVTPPFYGKFVDNSLDAVHKAGLMGNKGVLVAHYYKKDNVNREHPGYMLWKSKTHGNSIMDFFTVKS